VGGGCQARGGHDVCSQTGVVLTGISPEALLEWRQASICCRTAHCCAALATYVTCSSLHRFPVPQELEAQEARLQRRTEELSVVERRIAAAQQRLDGETERLKRAVAAVEEEGAALKVCSRQLAASRQ